MAISLGFHIVFASIGIAMPFLMAIAHWKWLRTHDPVYLKLTRAWSKGVAIFFATGAVSGTVLSFELGLLWPKFMEKVGPIIGMPFSWEGAAFFLEAIAIGVFLYGWDRVPRWTHWASGLVVGLSGVLSGLFVICANAWMNSPAGFEWTGSWPTTPEGMQAMQIDPWKAMFNSASLGLGVHMTLAAFAATGFAVAGVHAWGLLKSPGHALHRKAYRIALMMGGVAALIQPLSGDRLAKEVAIRQPIKLAAAEALYKTSQPASLVLGGIPNSESQTVSYGLHIPHLLSFLAHGDWNAEVKGLDSVPKENWPPVAVTHFGFQIMVGLGSFLALLGLFAVVDFFRKGELIFSRNFVRIMTLATPLGFIALEAGWVVTEVGRQPWIIYGIMKTHEAVTPMPGLVYPLNLFSGIYLFLSGVIGWLMMRQFRHVD